MVVVDVVDVDWRAAAARVVVEAVSADPRDVVLLLGEHEIASALAPRVGTLVRATRLQDVPGLSIIVHFWALRLLAPDAQRALVAEAGRRLPSRGLLVIGDVMFSLPAAEIDAPEQFADPLGAPPTTQQVEKWAREAGFLPDLHRFGAGVGVLVAVRS